ncbi:MAG: MBOAT family O-acyltransferase [Angelakisella sp.]
MVFSSILFLFRFMPIAFILYYLTPKKYKNFVLFVESLIFYSWGEVRYFPIMLFSVALDYTASNLIEKNRDSRWKMKFFLLLSICGNLGMLVFFKYTNFFAENMNALFGTAIPMLKLTLPLGISFYTFQTMSYTIDVYRGKVAAQKNLVDFSAFVVLFPQLIAGPIVRYTDISHELQNRTMDPAQIQSGIETFILGLGRKVLLANSIGALWSQVEAMSFTAISTPLAWLGILAFSLQIYFDFSGYSLMAIGLGRMLGFEFPQNFNNPYISKSATEFWRRWHITLGSWFREYLYIPLGGNRCSKSRQMWNLFVVWACTGFWHGASWNFVLWGLFFFVLLVLEKSFLLPHLERHPVLSRLYILPLLLFSWALFAITDFTRLGQFFTAMFTPQGGADWVYYLRNYAVVLLLGILFSTTLPDKLFARFQKQHVWVRYLCLGIVLVVSVAYLVDATYNPFLYFRF